MAQYGNPSYWDERYKRDKDYFDWYQRWSGLRDTLRPIVSKTDSILIVGCGQSHLTEDLIEDGYKNITNIDISSTAINFMKTKCPTSQWLTMNVLDMKDFPNHSFDVIIDKGTLDSILCGEGSTNNALLMLKEISRILKPTSGKYICITYGQPSFRHMYLKRTEFEWTVETYHVNKPTIGNEALLATEEKDSVHYIYVCKKVPAAFSSEMKTGERPRGTSSIPTMAATAIDVEQTL